MAGNLERREFIRGSVLVAGAAVAAATGNTGSRSGPNRNRTFSRWCTTSSLSPSIRPAALRR